jgi:hypothetical protein
MGKVKQMMMDQEVEFWDKALSTMFESETRSEFVSKMMPHYISTEVNLSKML